MNEQIQQWQDQRTLEREWAALPVYARTVLDDPKVANRLNLLVGPLAPTSSVPAAKWGISVVPGPMVNQAERDGRVVVRALA